MNEYNIMEQVCIFYGGLAAGHWETWQGKVWGEHCSLMIFPWMSRFCQVDSPSSLYHLYIVHWIID